jgi:hypothetical protein
MSSTSIPSSDKPAVHSSVARSLPNRTPADTGRQNSLFQRELDRLLKPDQKKEANKKDKIENDPRSQRSDHPDEKSRRGFGNDAGEQQGGEVPFDRIVGAPLRTAKITSPLNLSAPEMPPEHLARIAAAIQELASKGADASYHLQLPAGSSIIEGAVVARDAKGQLVIRLMCPGGLAPHLTAQLRNELVRRFDKKRLRIGGFEVIDGSNSRRVKSRSPA